MSVLGLNSGYTVKYTPPPEGVPEDMLISGLVGSFWSCTASCLSELIKSEVLNYFILHAFRAHRLLISNWSEVKSV